MNRLKSLLRRYLAPAAPGDAESLLDDIYGHNMSRKLGKPVLKDGTTIPWYTYAAIEFLDQFDLSGKTVFEWGCGNSSVYFAARSKKVISVEHDQAWFERMDKMKDANQEIVLTSLEEYPGGIGRFAQTFDIIVIDGQRRFDCVQKAMPFLNEGGMIILDNSDWFYLSAAYLREEHGLMQVDFHGFGPINRYTWTTSVFFNKGFKFPLKHGRQPYNPAGGLLHDEREIIEKEDGIFHTDNSKWVKTKLG